MPPREEAQIMSKKQDWMRADCSDQYGLPPCPLCGRKLYIEGSAQTNFRVAHFCRGKPRMQVKTAFCDTPEAAVDKAVNAEFTIRRWP